MKRLLFLIFCAGLPILLALGLVACGGGGGKSGAGAPDGMPSPKPSPVIQAWGHLECQKARNCDNKVLNLSQKQWWVILTVFSDRKENGLKDEEAVFSCGADFYDWGRTFYQELGDMSPKDLADLGQFATYVLDLKTCRMRSDLNPKMNEFFNKYLTGEIK